MKNKIYRTVSVEERLPDKDDDYIVSCPDWEEGLITAMFEDGEFKDTDIEEDNIITDYVKYWLEPIDTKDQAREVVSQLCDEFGLLPSEEEIKETCLDTVHPFSSDEFLKGANFILNHIKGGG